MWVIRDKSNRLMFFIHEKPFFLPNNGIWCSFKGKSGYLRPDLFPEIEFGNEKPVWKRFIRPEWLEIVSF